MTKPDREFLIPTTSIPVVNPETGEYFSPEGAEVGLTEEVERRMREGLLAAKFPEAGDKSDSPASEPDPEVIKALEGMKVDELRKLAGDYELEFDPRAVKADLVALLATKVELKPSEE